MSSGGKRSGFRYDVLIAPEFRAACRNLDQEAIHRVDLMIFRLRTGELAGVFNGKTSQIETEAGEIIDYAIERNLLVLFTVTRKKKK